MTWYFCKELIISDLRREVLEGKVTVLKFIYVYIVSESFKVTLWFRIGNYLMSKTGLLSKVLLILVKFIYK